MCHENDLLRRPRVLAAVSTSFAITSSPGTSTSTIIGTSTSTGTSAVRVATLVGTQQTGEPDLQVFFCVREAW